MIGLSLRTYFKQVVVKGGIVTGVAVVLPLLLKYSLPISFFSFILVCVVCALSVFSSVYFLGLNSSERGFLKDKLQGMLLKIRR